MLVFLMLSCSTDSNDSIKDPLEEADGTTLLEEYNNAICNVYLQDGCIEAFDICNEPIANYGDWADCMNSQYLSLIDFFNLFVYGTTYVVAIGTGASWRSYT